MQTRHYGWRIPMGNARLLGLFLFLFPIAMKAQTALSLESARNLSRQGEYASADVQFRQLLRQQPHELELQLAWAFNLSWGGRYGDAIKAFDQILQQWPQQVEALTGRAYTEAWKGDYAAARETFLQLQTLDPASLEARKGLAYVALWSRRYGEALLGFKSLTASYPEEADLWVALGLTQLQIDDQAAARRSIERAAQLAPQREDIRQILVQLQEAPAWLEVHAWGGYSQVGLENQWGLRAGQVVYSPHRRLQLWARYDNSLSLDNADFLRRNLSAPAWFSGGLYQWHDHLASRIEVGQRSLPGQGRQWFMQAEQIVYLPNRLTLKGGGFYAPRQDGSREWLSYVSAFVPLGSRLSLEPVYLLSRNAGTLWEHRGQLSLNYRPAEARYGMQAGVLYGYMPVQADGALTQSSWGLNFQAQAALGQLHWLMLNLRYETGYQQQFFTTSLGVRLRIEK